MAIAFVSAAAASNAASVTLGTHSTGDLLLAFVSREGSATPPDLPSGWTNVVATASPDNVSSRVGYKIAASGSETSGTWTNATGIIVLAYSGADGTTPVGANSEDSGGSTTMNYPALTLNVSSGSSWVVWFGCHSWGGGTLGVPSGTTQRANPTGSVMNIGAFDSNAGVSSWSSGTGSAPGFDDYQTRAIEILAASGGGGGGATGFGPLIAGARNRMIIS